jgi:tryptophanyl-tRNA synthetase
MSKSAPADAPGVIRMLDSPDAIRRKIRRAVTDSDRELRYDPQCKPGVSNLAEIVSALTDASPEDVVASCAGYGELKSACVDAVVAELEPIRRGHDELMADPAELLRTLASGAERASVAAAPVVRRVKDAMGIRP